MQASLSENIDFWKKKNEILIETVGAKFKRL